MIRKLIVLCVACMLASCNSSGSNETRVRLVQTGSAAPLSLFVNEELIATLPYGQASSYQEVNDGNNALRGIVGATTAFSNQVNLDNDTDYSVVTVSENGGTTPVLLVDENNIPDAGNFRLRAVNASSRVQSVDIYALRENETVATHDANFSSLFFKQASNYDQIDRNEYVIFVTAAGSKTVLASLPSNDFGDIETWTVFVVDDVGGSGISLKLTQDRDPHL